MNKVNQLEIKPANQSQARLLAGYYTMSSDGVSKYVWSKLAEPGEDLLDVGARRYARENTEYSYQNCKLAELNGEPVAMLVAFPMHSDPKNLEDDPVLKPFSILEEDNSYYICGVAVDEHHRGRGIGSALLREAELDAQRAGYDKVSLIVFEQNSRPHALYLRMGYREVMRTPIVPHPFIKYTGDALLMVKTLNVSAK